VGFVKVIDASEIPPGSSMKLEHEGQAVLVANVGGRYCAIANTCPHKGGDLSRGTLREGTVTCPRHGARFDLGTGKNLGDAKFLWRNVSVKDVRSYLMKVEGTDVLVEMK
jgi:3-phenylpropionate/trans-cinnamate dioxygenase ferredoxin subunit